MQSMSAEISGTLCDPPLPMLRVQRYVNGEVTIGS